MSEIILKEGLPAPDFTLMGSDQKQHRLSDYLGKRIILYFYPRDNTPGCSKEAEAFRDHFHTFANANTVILGISRDSLASHDKFIAKYNLPFVLLSDSDEEVCKLYDVLKEKNMYGRISLGIERSTFIIDEQGIITKIYRKVKVAGHVESCQLELGL